jgi:cytochrome b561
MDQATGYTRTQIRLLWIAVLLIALQYLLHDTISDAWDGYLDGAEMAFDPLIAQHVLMGGLVAILVLWRLTHAATPPPERKKPGPARRRTCHALAQIALHVAVAPLHQFVLKTNLMERMKRPVG